MDPDSNFSHHPAVPPTPHKRTIWQKLGAGSLSISVIFHVVLLLIGLIWVLKIIPPPSKKDVEFLAKSGGGGSPASESQAKKHQVQMMQPTMSRVSALDAVSNFVLPDPEDSSQMASLGSLSSGGLSKGLGGEGSGGGKGNGNGTGFGNGMAPGMSDGKGSKNPFGMTSLTKNALVGTFYDLKQTSDRKQTEMTDDQMREEMKEIMRRGYKERVFDKYYKAPRVLYQTKVFIPAMSADAAPAAFECEKEVQPKRWIVVYRGAVQAPKTGKFRFVGAGDDLLAVRFNNRAVFDFGYTLASTGTHIANGSVKMDGTRNDSGFDKEVRRLSPMRIPVTFYKYQSTPGHNARIGGLAVGPEFEVKEGQAYPIEILIGEIPGGSFSMSLLIEEVGVNYKKDPAGFPILPLFRLDNSQPSSELKGEAPPYDPNGPIWKSVEGAAKSDI